MVHPERVFRYNNLTYQSGTIVYWMQRDQRVSDNWALIFAQERAFEERQPLHIVFNLLQEFSGASTDHYRFMLAGLKKVANTLSTLSIPFTILQGDPVDKVPEFLVGISAGFLITDFNPLRHVIKWKRDVNGQITIPFVEIDSHNILPARTISDHREYSAFTLRKKISRRLDEFLTPVPKVIPHPFNEKSTTESDNANDLLKDKDNKHLIVQKFRNTSGEDEAVNCLKQFLNSGLIHYHERRNFPEKDGQSGLSSYLHFGQISAQRIAQEVREVHGNNLGAAAFLEELIVRRELADNYCLHCQNYDNAGGFHTWASQTLDKHRNDPRPYLYDESVLEMAQTHDPLWNAAQNEMVHTGKMHGYLRMYWAKKILEWTGSPELAMDLAVYLNDKYELDGRDPNGYAGIAWAIGGVHDRPWSERHVFGMIRYMNYEGCNRKFNIREYIRNVNSYI